MKGSLKMVLFGLLIGRALTAAGTSDGKLALTCCRAGNNDQITLEPSVPGS